MSKGVIEIGTYLFLISITLASSNFSKEGIKETNRALIPVVEPTAM